MGRGPGNTRTEQLLRTLKLQDGNAQLNNFIKKNFKNSLTFINGEQINITSFRKE